MRTTIKIACLSLALMISSQAFGQKLGIKAGYNSANVHVSSSHSDYKFDSNSSYHVGLAADFPLIGWFSLESGLYASSKGFKMGDGSIKTTFSPTYLEIPVKLKLSIGLSKLNVYAAAGGYFDVGIGGNTTVESKVLGIENKVKESIKWGSDGLKRVDYGTLVGAGVQISRFDIGLGYQFGMADLMDAEYDIKHVNKVFSLSLGFWF